MKFKLKLNVILTIVAIPLFLMGLAFTLATTTMLGNFGYDANLASIHMARTAGSALIGYAVLAFLARNAGPSPARNAVVVSLALFFLLEAIVDIRGIISGVMGPEGWFTGVFLWLVFFALVAIAGWSARSES